MSTLKHFLVGTALLLFLAVLAITPGTDEIGLKHVRILSPTGDHMISILPFPQTGSSGCGIMVEYTDKEGAARRDLGYHWFSLRGGDIYEIQFPRWAEDPGTPSSRFRCLSGRLYKVI